MRQNLTASELDELELGLRVQGDKQFQDRLLAGVSRTYAAAVPALPQSLRLAATNAFLLCQAAETIDNLLDAPAARRQEIFGLLAQAVHEPAEANELAVALHSPLLAKLPPVARELLRNLPRLVRVPEALPARQGQAVRHCIRQVCDGLSRLQPLRGPHGLPDLATYDDYAYYCNGALSEFLTSAFCGYSPAIARRGAELHALAPAFGRGLCATQLLKNVWRDRARGVCYLPRDVFRAHGLELGPDQDWATDPRFRAGYHELITRAHSQLRQARDYILRLPPSEDGIRRFCFWPVGLALLTLQRLRAASRGKIEPGGELKVSPTALRMAVPASRWLVRHDAWLNRAFRLASLGLPPLRRHRQPDRAP